MKKLRQAIKQAYQRTVRSIAFLPALISFCFLVFFLITRIFEHSQLGQDVGVWLKPLLVENPADSRLILGSIIGGLISLIVFSFTMVMLVLNMATSTLSPRVLPGLITRKNHQIVLGFYLGSLSYSILLVINLTSADVPSWGIFFSMFFMLLSFALFVYFIHSISISIQVDKIVESIFQETRKGMKKRQEKYGKVDKQPPFPHSDDWYTLKATSSGYLKNIETSRLLDILKSNDLQAEITVDIGFFTVVDFPFLKVNKNLSEDPELRENIKRCFNFFIEEYVGSHYSFGMKQITEIAVRALSPGVNDPGTAIKCTDLLFMLLREKMMLPDREYEIDSDGNLRLMYRSLPLDELLFLNLTPMRQYGHQDTLVMHNILEGLKNLAYTDQFDKGQSEIIANYATSMISDIKKNITQPESKIRINRMIDRMNELLERNVLEHI